MKPDKETIIKRVIYRSTHRGCKETDYIFGGFANDKLATLSDFELEVYEKLLEVDDTTLYNWFAGISPIPETYNSSVIQKIKAYNESRTKDI
jgi:antitoxin CptB